MTLRAAFAEAEITPELGSHVIGWLKEIRAERVLDPLFARVALFDDGSRRLAFVQLDTLSVRWTTAQGIRRRAGSEHGLQAANVMVAATHNHCGPAVAGCGDVPRDDAYIEMMTERVTDALGRAVASLEEAELGFASATEFGLSHNRRTVLRDGTAATHDPGPRDEAALFTEGPVDPEVAVLAARRGGGEFLGVVVNFACHPTHHGGTGAVTAGYPGQLARALRERGVPATVFLNGACGNLSLGDPARGLEPSMEEMGERLAEDALGAISKAEFSREWRFGAARTTVDLPYREVTDSDVAGTARGAQRFVDPAAYDRAMPGLLARFRERGMQPAEVQALFMRAEAPGVDLAFVGIPSEYFVQLGLRVKEQSHPRRALVVGHANGMVGYVPTRVAFDRGGYETTFAPWSRMARGAGDMLADAAVGLVRSPPREASLSRA